MLSSAEARALEPRFDDSVLSALYVEDDSHVDPESLVAGLVERLRRRNTRLVSGATVRRLTRCEGSWTASVDDHAVYVLEAKVGCSPFSRTTRLAGTLELGGLDETMGQAAGRDDALRSSLLQGLEHARRPRLGRASTRHPRRASIHRRRVDATRTVRRHGSQHARSHLARGTGAALADAMDSGRPSDILSPFRLDRRCPNTQTRKEPDEHRTT